MRLILPLACITVIWLYTASVATAAVPTDSVGTGELLYSISAPSSGSAGSYFAEGLAASPGHVAVTAWLETVGTVSQAGAIYLFDEETGGLRHSIFNPEPESRDEFGRAAAFVDGQLLVSAPSDNFGALNAGSVYLYDPETGVLNQTIRSPEPLSGSGFGSAVTAIDGGFAVGAFGINRAFAGAGAVYLYDLGASVPRVTLENRNPTAPVSFGGALAFTDNRVAVSARWDRQPTSSFSVRAGAVQVFDATTGQFMHALRSTHPVEEGQFGFTLAAIDGKIVVGAPMETANGRADSGRVYVFDALTGQLDFEIENPTGREGEFFGWSVDIAAGNILVGAPRTFVGGRSRVGTAVQHIDATAHSSGSVTCRLLRI